MAEIYQRPNSPVWYADFSVGNKRVRKSTKETNKKAARKEADRLEREAREAWKAGGDIPEISLRDALVHHYMPKHARNARKAGYQHICDKVSGLVPGVCDVLKDVMMHDLSTSLLRRYQMQRLADGAAEQTIDREMAVVSAAYHLVEEDYRVKPGVKFPKFNPKGKPRPISRDEEERLLAELDPKRPLPARGGGVFLISDTAGNSATIHEQRQSAYDLTIALLDTGARFGEVASLTWRDVDTEEFKWVHIYRTKVKNEGILATTTRLREVLRRRYQDRPSSDNPYVFYGWKRTSRGDVVPAKEPVKGTQAIRRAMNKLGFNSPENVKRYGRRDVRSFRDTFATRLRQKGMGLEDIQDLLGHSSMQMTQKYADQNFSQVTSRAAQLLEET